MRKILRGFRGAIALGVVLFYIAAVRATESIEYRDSDGVIKSANCTLVAGNTTEFADNGWYAVKGEVTCGSIRVAGETHLILCDGAKLTVNGGDKAGIQLVWDGRNALTIYGQSKGTGTLVANGGTESAGIGLTQYENTAWGGKLTINGGNVIANGNRTAAGIGGSNCFDNGAHRWYGGGCVVTINGGQVTATGGDSGGNYPAAGIGGAGYGAGNSVTIHGGTVIAKGGVASFTRSDLLDYKYGWGIGWGRMMVTGQDEVKSLSLTIDGGSVLATTPDEFNVGRQCVTVNCKDLGVPLKLSGINYGSRDLYTDNTGKVCLWLPNGDYKFALSDETKGYYYHANVSDHPVTADFANYGFRVNGTDVGQCVGSGWTFDLNSKVLNFNEGRTYTLTDSATSDAPQINVNASGATVVLDGVKLTANNRPALVVKSGVNATLRMKGTSTLSATGGAGAMQLDGTLTVDLAENADRLSSKIEVASSGAVAVAGDGKLTVNNGTFCAHANSMAIKTKEDNLVIGANEVMKAGSDAGSAQYVTKHGGYGYVMIAPALAVTVAKVPNVGIVNVLAGMKQELKPIEEGGAVYRVLKGEEVFVQYESTNEMYLVTGENPAKVTVNDHTTVGKDQLVVSAIQVLTDGSYYLESHGTEWIDTKYRPNPTTRIEAEFNPLTKNDNYLVFFGAASADSPADGVMMRYFNDKRINGWFCNENWQDGCSQSEFENTLVMAELKAGEMTLNGVKTPIPTTTAWPCDGSIYLFCGNKGGEAWRHQQMRLYSFRIWEWNYEEGREELVRELVPFKTEDGVISGLYDRREGEVKESRVYRNAAKEGKEFALGRDSGFRYRVWDEEAKAMRYRVCTDAIVVTADTARFEDGKWYVVTNAVSRKTITVSGAAHLILCDGAKLSVAGEDKAPGIEVRDGNSLTIYGQTLGTGELVATGGYNGAGIGGGQYSTGGTVTIDGGRVTANAGENGAAIGGGYSGLGGTVTIHGGRVTANGSGGGKGIGGGSYAGGGTVTICGGTVEADGWNGQGLGGAVTITGGSVRTKAYESQPKNAEAQLYCVTVKCPGFGEEGRGLRVEGLNGYGVNDIRAINGELYLWLPVGRHVFTVSDGKKTYSYFAVVNGRVQSITVNPLTVVDLQVNGQNILTELSGTGWDYNLETQVLTLKGGTDYVISGVSTGDLVRIEVTADANVMFSNATIRVSSGAVVTVKDHHTLHLSAGNGDDAAYLFGDGVKVISGGTNIVERGSVCLWSTDTVPVDGAFSINRETEIMCVGTDDTHLPYVDEYVATNLENRIILVAPRCRFTVPEIEFATVEVSVRNPDKVLVGRPNGNKETVYELMLGDTAYVKSILDDRHVWLGERGEQAFLITGDTQVPRDRLPVAVGYGIRVDYQTAKVDPKTAAVSYETTNVTAQVFDDLADKPGVIGKSTYGIEEWYVVTGQVECASVCVTTGTVNMILYPGAELTLWGEDGQPGVGVMANAGFNVYGCEEGGGTLIAYGGTYASGIGGGGVEVLEDESPDADAGRITVNGGMVIAVGGDFGAGIGGGALGAGAELTVNGGTVFAYGGYDAEDIGGGAFGEDGRSVVNGGSVMANSVEAKPVNAAEARLYRVYAVSEHFIPTNDVPLTVKGLGGYGTADVFANDDGALCFYLPNGHYEFTINGWKCVADVQDGTESASVSEERENSEEGRGEREEGEDSEEGRGEREEGEGESEEGEEWEWKWGEDDDEEWEWDDGSEKEDGEDINLGDSLAAGVNAEVLGLEVGEKVKVTIRSKENWQYWLRRVTFEDGKAVVGQIVYSATAEDDTLTLEDEEPLADAGFYVVQEVGEVK